MLPTALAHSSTVAPKSGPRQQSCAATELTSSMANQSPWEGETAAREGALGVLRALVRAGKHRRSIATGESKVVVDIEVRGRYYTVGLSGKHWPSLPAISSSK